MKTTLTTAQALSVFIGRRGYYVSNPMRFPVEILDAKVSYGSVRWKIRPVGGNGECWVQSSSVTFADA